MKNIQKLVRQKISGLVENLLIKRYRPEPICQPIFILGLPRSGTTLLYQYIVYRLEVSYFMNGTDQWPKAPVTNTYMRHRMYGEYKADFENSYGYIQGNNSPHEAGNFWGQFFGYQDYFGKNNLSVHDSKKIKRTISAIENIYGNKVFTNKNVKHILRIPVLKKIFPQAIFIIINRNPKDVALSLLRGRYKNMGTAKEWWSVRPSNWRVLDSMNPPEQIAHQIYNLQNRLELDLHSIDSSQQISISYREFCESPENIIQTIHANFSVDLKRTIPKSGFHISINHPSNHEEKKLISEINNLY